jgi:chromosome segregation ATPase
MIEIDKKTYIIFGLIIVFSILIFLGAGTSAQERKRLNQQIAKQEEEKKGLNAKLEEMVRENKRFDEKVVSMNKDLERLTAEKTNVQGRYDTILIERDKLMDAIRQMNLKLANAEKEKTSLVARKEEPAKAGQEQPLFFPTTKEEAYWAGLLKQKAGLEVKLETISKELKEANLNNEQLQLEINYIKRDNTDFDREFAYNKKLLDNLTLELTREKNDKFQIEQSLKEFKSENKNFKQQLKILGERKIEAEKRLGDIQSRNAELENSLEKMEAFIREKMIQIEGLKDNLGVVQKTTAAESQNQSQDKRKETVQLQPIIIRPQDAKDKKETPVIKGTILAVNREDNFAIINLGQDSGVNIGDTFRVYNPRDEVVANIEVLQVRKSISACDIKPPNAPVIVGYSVK